VGNLCRLPGDGPKRYGREIPLGTRREARLALAPWLKRALHKPQLDLDGLEKEVFQKIPSLTQGGRLLKVFPRGDQLVTLVTYEERTSPTFLDSHGRPLLNPPIRQAIPRACRGFTLTGSQRSTLNSQPPPCPQLAWCTQVEITASAAFAWRTLGLIDPNGAPTQRGLIFSFFQHGEGLAIAAGLEDETYAVEELIFDLANLRGGPRFAGDESTIGGRLAVVCQHAYGRADFDGYLQMGVPQDYAAGAGDALREILLHGLPRQKLVTESLRLGDIERAILEWRSLLRQIGHAPDCDWPRWRQLKKAATTALEAGQPSATPRE
jgi:hypothetical protein